MLNCRTPVAVFVGPSGARAASAGFLITVAADVAAMAPGHQHRRRAPGVRDRGNMDEVMSKKVASDAAAYIRSKAERRGRNVEMAEKAVLESRSFTEREALDRQAHRPRGEATSPELVRALEGREVTRFDGSRGHPAPGRPRHAPVPWTGGRASCPRWPSPQMLFLLLLGALAGIGAELSHPGALFPGVVGAVCLILFLFAAQIIPVNWAGVLLILLALFLFAAEVKVPPTASDPGGIAAMILGRDDARRLARGGDARAAAHAPARRRWSWPRDVRARASGGGGPAPPPGHGGGGPGRPARRGGHRPRPEGWVRVHGRALARRSPTARSQRRERDRVGGGRPDPERPEGG